MKKITMIALAMFTAVGAGAQTIYDATNIAQKELNGTARFVGMGGAMGALGGDISTIGTNPAGIGIYRSNDAMLTFGYSMTGTESNYVGNKFETNKNRWSFDNAGFVIASKIGNHTPLRYVNFGFNYHKSKSFYKNMTMQGVMGSIDNQYVSQVRLMRSIIVLNMITRIKELIWTMVARIFINIIMLDGWGLWGIKVHLFLRI